VLRLEKLLSGKIAVVTGASRGIGRAVCNLFAKEGATVLACVRDVDASQLAWQSSLERTGKFLSLIPLDLSDQASVKSAAKTIRSICPAIDIIVNCAGIASGATFHLTPLDMMRSVFDLNVFAQILFSQSLTRLMGKGERGGSIINISSSATHQIDPGTMAYGASKQAFERVSKSMAVELAAQKIRVNVISPGITLTKMLAQMDLEAKDKLISHSLLKKAALPDDIANAALFLASDLSSHITAQILCVDGGTL